MATVKSPIWASAEMLALATGQVVRLSAAARASPQVGGGGDGQTGDLTVATTAQWLAIHDIPGGDEGVFDGTAGVVVFAFVDDEDVAGLDGIVNAVDGEYAAE